MTAIVCARASALFGLSLAAIVCSSALAADQVPDIKGKWAGKTYSIVAGSGGVLNLPRVGASSWALGVVLMLAIGLVVGALPAMSAMRLRIVDALAGR